MVSTEIKVGTVCNNNCVFCLNDNHNTQKTSNQIKQEIIQAKETGADTINFTGGEITIREDFFDLLSFTKMQGLKIRIQSNGRTFAYADFTEKVCAFGIENFLISLHANNEELYTFLCGVNGYTQVMDGIKNLISHNQKVTINCVLSKLNIKEVKKIAEHHSNIGAACLQFGWVTPKGRAILKFDNLVPKFEESSKYLFEALNWLDENYKGEVYTLGIPYCVLKKMSFFKSEEYSDQVVIKNGAQKRIFANAALQNKLKPNQCELCFYNEKCEGIFTEYANRFGLDEFKLVSEPFSNFLGIVGFCPEQFNESIPNYGAYRVSNDLLLSIEKSKRIDKLIYFVGPRTYFQKKHRQSGRIKIMLISSVNEFARRFEKEFLAFYCINRGYTKKLEDFSFKKICLIHSQDAPDILEEYARYIFECNKNNCLWISPSVAGRDIALNIFKIFESKKGTGFKHRIEVIPWGIESANKNWPEYDGKIVKLIYFGRIDSSYKADILPLIETFHKLKRKYANIELHLAGFMHPNEKQRLERHITDGVFYHGEIPEKNKSEFIHQHHLLISPSNSTQETFGVVLLEAAAQGLVCIASDWTGHNELLKQGNLVKMNILCNKMNIPVGREHAEDFLIKNQIIAVGANIDSDDLLIKMERAINEIMRNKKESSLKQDIEEYLWSNITKKHECIWFSEDNHEIDKTKEMPIGMSVPVRTFIPMKNFSETEEITENNEGLSESTIKTVLKENFGIIVLKTETIKKRPARFKIYSDKGIFFMKHLFYVPKDSEGELFMSAVRNFREELIGGGIDILSPLKNARGKDFFNIGENHYELYCFLDGLKQIEDIETLCTEIAKIHKIKILKDYVNHKRSSISMIENMIKKTDSKILQGILQELAEYENKSERTMRYGDFHAGNIFSIDNKIVLGDFEICTYASKEYDLGGALSSNIFFDGQIFKTQKAKNFIRCYNKSLHISDYARKHVFHQILLHLCVKFYSVRAVAKENAFVHEKILGSRIKYFLENKDFLIDFFMRVPDYCEAK